VPSNQIWVLKVRYGSVAFEIFGEKELIRLIFRIMSKKLSEEEFLKATLTKFTRVKNEVHQKLNDTLNETINKINLSLSINGKPSFVNSFLNESDINPELLQKYIDKQ